MTFKPGTQAAMIALEPFLSAIQLSTMRDASQSEEGGFFQDKFIEMAALIEAMPQTYQNRDKGRFSIVHLHYFHRGSDWYITEKDAEGGTDQAYGYAILGGHEPFAEFGYISIAELVLQRVEIDLYFTPKPLIEILASRDARGLR